VEVDNYCDSCTIAVLVGDHPPHFVVAEDFMT
jgi:hypothetical protein